MAVVWPPDAADSVSRALRRAHVTGTSRTLAQDLAFSVDQLVEIALRALSPAVNDTFTALTCIDWLGEGLCKVTTQWRPVRVLRDIHGFVRVITAHVSYRGSSSERLTRSGKRVAGCPPCSSVNSTRWRGSSSTPPLQTSASCCSRRPG